MQYLWKKYLETEELADLQLCHPKVSFQLSVFVQEIAYYPLQVLPAHISVILIVMFPTAQLKDF